MKDEKSVIRKHYIDNLRNFTILLLFPVHTFMIWNGTYCTIPDIVCEEIF